MKALTTSVAVLTATLATPALASSDGVLGPTSSGSFTVNATVSQPTTDNVQVFGLDDFSLSLFPGAADVSDSKSFCIIRSPGGGFVNITISSFDAADVGFLVKAPGGGSQIPLDVLIRNYNVTNGGIAEELSPLEGTPHPNVMVSSSCNDILGDPTSMELRVRSDSPAGVVTADPGIYSGSFLITVAPQ